MTPTSESLVKLFSYYRDAEIRGATLLMKMMQKERDPEAQVLFSRHIADETRHAWMWTKRIKDEKALPVEVPDGYQRRLGKVVGIPSSLVDLFALTVVVEERSAKRYTEHANSPICDEITRPLLVELTKDEKWHVAWMEEWLLKMAKDRGKEDDVVETLKRYRRLEEEVFADMQELERGWLGFSFSDFSVSPEAAKAG